MRGEAVGAFSSLDDGAAERVIARRLEVRQHANHQTLRGGDHQLSVRIGEAKLLVEPATVGSDLTYVVRGAACRSLFKLRCMLEQRACDGSRATHLGQHDKLDLADVVERERRGTARQLGESLFVEAEAEGCLEIFLAVLQFQEEVRM